MERGDKAGNGFMSWGTCGDHVYSGRVVVEVCSGGGSSCGAVGWSGVVGWWWRWWWCGRVVVVWSGGSGDGVVGWWW